VDLQRHDLVAVEREDELKLDGTAREISGEAVGDDGLAVFLNGRKRLDRVLVFLPGFSVPLLDRGQTSDRLAFVSHNGMFGKALVQGLRIIPVLGGDITSDGCWKIDRDMSFSCRLFWFRNHAEVYAATTLPRYWA
jgi:hypothetical protein